jgi:hypothetical protein
VFDPSSCECDTRRVPPDLVDQTLAFLASCGVHLAPGLTPSELSALEERFGFGFAPDHRALLAAAQPTGDGWVDWRADREAHLSAALAEPVSGVLFDVDQNVFWPRSWGPRPTDAATARRVAEARLTSWPKLVPLYGHRYLPAAPAAAGSPVISVHQSDVIHYGSDLLNYVTREFRVHPATPLGPIRHPVGPWSALAQGAENADL